MINNVSETNTLAQDNYTTLLGYFFVELAFINANRAGEARNMTLQEFNSAKLKDDNTLIVKVKNHKTYYKYGAANVIVDGELREQLIKYRDFVRPRLAAISEDPNFFLSSDGSQIASGNMPLIMDNYWEKMDMQGSVCSNILRKSTVVYTRRQ